MSLHNEKTVSRHAVLLADYAQMRGGYGCFTTAAKNPYREHLADAMAVLPKRVSVLAARRAVEILGDRSASRYAAHVWDYDGIVTPR